MVTKQIKEQLEILYQHTLGESVDLEFVATHAEHLAQLARSLAWQQRLTVVTRDVS